MKRLLDYYCELMDFKAWIVFVTLLGLLSQSLADQKVCNSKRFCDECITAHSDCAWCKDKEFAEIRCDLKAELDKKCVEIESPNNTLNVLQNQPVKDGSEIEDPVQVSPQKLKLRLRPGRTLQLEMTYQIAKNLPIDMYFVLDFTTTMSHRLKLLANLTENLINQLKRNFTSNIEIGFGAFLDKPLQPFTITTPKMLENPCLNANSVCGPSYGYIHRRKLNRNIQEFIDAVRNGETSSNFDPMEGGLDAVLQASVCPHIVGWRNQSRRVLIYISDGGFHFAGDAKLAGVDRPNDGLCHMVPYTGIGAVDGEYIYSHSTLMDYPSYGMVSKALDENKINSFFLVSDELKSMYEGLTETINQAETNFFTSSGSTQTIANQIQDYYTTLAGKIDITAEDIPDELEVKVSTDCSNKGVKNTYNLKEENVKCENLQIGRPVMFDVNVNLLQCPSDPAQRSRKFRITPSGLQEALEIEVEYTCDCNCEASEDLNQEKCTYGNGTYDCGVCKCNPGRSGVKCQCDQESAASTDESNCKKNNESSVICENHGTCKCGQCVCLTNYDGRYCECDSSLCIMKGQNKKCSGIEQGDCICGTCKCKGGYYGQYCQCPPEKNCLGENGLVCSGHGDCECGKCVCHQNYEGDTCENCPKCDLCRKCGYRSCVECLERSGITSDNVTMTDCSVDCQSLNITRVDRFENDEPCGFIDSSGCELNYLVSCAGNNIYLQIARGKLCTTPPDPLLIALPVLGGILGVGVLLLIIWKILTMFYDKFEYARFEHEIQNPKWSQTDNPIYKTPVTSNQNPVYKGTVD